LVKNDFGIFTTNVDSFPDIPITFELPYQISNAIIEINVSIWGKIPRL
jgi:hypothetical protein